MNDKGLEKDIQEGEGFADKTGENLSAPEQILTKNTEIVDNVAEKIKELVQNYSNEQKQIEIEIKKKEYEQDLEQIRTEHKQEMERMRAEIELKSVEVETKKDAHLRLMAEYDNYQKRTIREKADLIRNGGEKIFIGLLPIIDDFERALKTIEEVKEVDTIKEGIGLIYRKFLSFLQKNGIKAIDSVGEKFEADLFEAVATVPAESEEQKGKIIDNLQTGYTLNDKVIRHAKVIVAN
ncbi:nucleotide exchange factor GrpE [Candidatus Azobacteroides pseudotrichonymphae]|uniref:nucleotide exchange factor GrpE n=1 Tax=Candidatus Azobacteroides pseudotrichonymphae TaxID=511435 RepID=UPI00030E21A3|nr:nucleotide exchange factor GrpE [Candidatus Azobacteroides pseudotrichonymphae]